jgi:ribonuclease Z
MTCVVQILSIDNTFHSGSVVVTTENSRFLFEVGEGTQRLIGEHKVRVGKICCILTTSAHIESIGGLTGNGIV